MIAIRGEYTNHDHHKPLDEMKLDWDLSGAAEDLRLLFGVGYAVAQSAVWPTWKAGTECQARRDSMMGGK